MEHGLLMENLLDLAHAPFTHTSTFAKGWPVPDSVKFKARPPVAASLPGLFAVQALRSTATAAAACV